MRISDWSSDVCSSDLVEDGKYAEAIPLLEQVVAKDAKNADALNYLGYSNRQLGNNDAALAHYQAALAVEPDHRGANEYLGELYLTLGDLPKAEERLDVLDGADRKSVVEGKSGTDRVDLGGRRDIKK